MRVVIPAPYWVSYMEMVKLAEGTNVIVPAGIEQDFKITLNSCRLRLLQNEGYHFMFPFQSYRKCIYIKTN